MFELMRRERRVRWALKAIAAQHVTMILPGNVSVVENSPPHTEEFEIAARTAQIRGWVTVLFEGMPTAQLQFQGARPIIPSQAAPQTHYRLTEGGWAAIQGTHVWLVATFIVSLLALLASIAAVAITFPK
jgi:hypothetical protein